MIRKAILLIIAIYTLTFCVSAAKASAPDGSAKDEFITPAPLPISNADRVKEPEKPVIFRHGDISWLPKLALEAGWREQDLKKLGEIILRESGGCPNRRGGDKVDKNCNITGVSEWDHRSDTGLVQINGVNFDPTRNKFAPICLQMSICTQEPLLDPVTNLKAGKLLFDYWQKATGNGWTPWDPCNRTRTCK